MPKRKQPESGSANEPSTQTPKQPDNALPQMRSPARDQDPEIPSELTCPLCFELLRSLLLSDARSQEEVAQRVAAQHPALHAARAEEEKERLAMRQVEYKRLYVGNYHAVRFGQGSNHHDWTFFVRMDTREDEELFIDRVVVRLHPTFHPSTISLDRAPFQVRQAPLPAPGPLGRLGWGIFVVTAIVLFKEEWGHDPLVASWMLDFDGQGSQQEIEIELVKDTGSGGEAAGPQQLQQGRRRRRGTGGVLGQQQPATGSTAGEARDWREAILRGLAAVNDDDEDESWHPQDQEVSSSEGEEEGPGGADAAEGRGGSDADSEGALGRSDHETEEGGGEGSEDEDAGESPRDLAGDYYPLRYRTLFGSPRHSSGGSDEGPTYNDDEQDESEGEGAQSGGRQG
ncbi:hypothetical protein N2152v2_010952 [Parachlorella kessleri]